jgi:hypothetical protein
MELRLSYEMSVAVRTTLQYSPEDRTVRSDRHEYLTPKTGDYFVLQPYCFIGHAV